MTADPRLGSAPANVLMRNSVRLFWLALGVILIGLGAVLAVLPGHIGVVVVVVGLAMVLRNSRAARKSFVRFKHRHPKIAHPLRRLMRRKPQVIPVIWQSMLRTERFFLRRYGFMGRVRRWAARGLRRPRGASR